MKGFLVAALMVYTYFLGFVPISVITAVFLTIPSKVGPLVGADDAAKLSRHIFRKLNFYPVRWWFELSSLLLTYMLGVRVVVHFADDLVAKLGTERSVQKRLEATFKAQRIILMANHRTTIDWMFLWVLVCPTGNVASLKIVLKKSMRNVPMLGWVSSTCPFVFLARRKFAASQVAVAEAECNTAEVTTQPLSPPNDRGSELTPINLSEPDIDTITRSVQYFNKYPPYVVLLFPEGTDLSQSNLKKSHVFARAHKLPICEHVLIPRRKGLTAFLQQMPMDAESKLIDVTIAYEDYVHGERPTETSIFFYGRSPPAVHFFIESVDIEHDPAKIKTYLSDTFLRKEKWLGKFYKEGPPPGGVDICHLLPRWGSLAIALVLHVLVIYTYSNYFFGMCVINLLTISLYLIFDVTEILLSDLDEDKKKS
eukprot:GEMP01021718.1.p1 GENE.GEMP01021718.1~~GEMP01021718.1.p1  ORF type:complete len:452 (+),score=57.64 GEMP01021718.1:85-1356(+)